MPAAHPPETWTTAAKMLAEGRGTRSVCSALAVGASWVEKVRAEARSHEEGFEVGLHYMSQGSRIRGGKHTTSEMRAWKAKLPADASRALDDISLFALRYFGLKLAPWQVEAANLIVKLIATPEEEYVVVNVPPGAGKSTFFTYIVPCWLTCRDRTLRGLIGSASQSTAEWYLRRIKNALTTTIPMKAKARDKELGVAFDAAATLAQDYSQFRPDDRSGLVWAADAISVIPPPGIPPTEKENTWHAFGRSRNFLGARVDFQIWDDTYDPTQVRTVEARDELRRWWDEQVESRLEPRGLLVLVGQRLGPDDLYRHALDKPDDTLDDDDPDAVPAAPERDFDAAASLGPDGLPVKVGKYRHIIYRAHYPEKCSGRHTSQQRPWPESCLLAPSRVSWKRIAAVRNESPARFATIYQQEDTPTGAVLVHPLWVSGGRDKETGIVYTGCWDEDRGEWELPRYGGNWFIAASVDPSPTKWWSIQLWATNDRTHHRYLIAHHRAKMGGPGLIDWDEPRGQWTGIMPDWHERALRNKFKITHWIIEQAAAQRFLLQFAHVTRWQQHHDVHIVGHDTTSRNKSDEKFGVTMLATPWRQGLIRLPGRAGESRANAQKLVDEVTRWPEGRTEDCVMAEWFFEHNKDRLFRPSDTLPVAARRPSWLTSFDMRRSFAGSVN